MRFDLLRNSHPRVPLYTDGCELLVFSLPATSVPNGAQEARIIN